MPSLDLLNLALALQETPLTEGGEDAGGPNFLLPMLAIAAIFWFVMIAPERKRRKERESMIEALKKGDKVMTTSGMYATVAQVQGDVVTLQIADNTRVKFALAAVQGKVDEDTKKDGKEKTKSLQPQKNKGEEAADEPAEESVAQKS